MKWTVEDSLESFPFWSQAAENAEVLTSEQFYKLEQILEDEGPWRDVDINDLFWHEPEIVAQYLGFANWEALEYHNEHGDEPCEQDFEEVKDFLQDEIRQQEEFIVTLHNSPSSFSVDLEDEEEELRKLLDIRADEDIIAEMAEKYREELMKGNCKEDAFQEALWYQK